MFAKDGDRNRSEQISYRILRGLFSVRCGIFRSLMKQICFLFINNLTYRHNFKHFFQSIICIFPQTSIKTDNSAIKAVLDDCFAVHFPLLN